MSIARPTSGGVLFLLLTLAAAGVAVMNVGLMTALCASALAGSEALATSAHSPWGSPKALRSNSHCAGPWVSARMGCGVRQSAPG